MNSFYKVVDNDGFITGFGTNGSDDTISLTEEEYANLLAFFNSIPVAADGFTYMLRDNPREYVLETM